MTERCIARENVQRALVMLEDGASLSSVAAAVGCCRGTVSRWARAMGYTPVFGRRGGVLPRRELPAGVVSLAVEKSSSHGRRLGLHERTVIEVLHAQGKTRREIAESIGFSASTVTREINRSLSVNGRYFARGAQVRSDVLRRRPKPLRLAAGGELRRIVVECLNKRFSPYQVALHLYRKYPERGDLRVSHETIYQALYVQGRGSLREELRVEKALRSGRKARVPRSRFPKGRPHSWVEGCNISERPAEVEDRAVPGHWEGDLVVGTKNQSAIITLAERTSRFTLIKRLPAAHDTESVIPVLIEMVRELPGELKKTLTWDQGRSCLGM